MDEAGMIAYQTAPSGGNDVWGTLIGKGVDAVLSYNMAKVQAKREATTQSNQVALARVNPWGWGTVQTLSSPNGTGTAAYNPLFPTGNAYPQAAGKPVFDSVGVGSIFGVAALVAVVLLVVSFLARR